MNIFLSSAILPVTGIEHYNRLIVILLVLSVLIFSITGCNSKNEKYSHGEPDSSELDNPAKYKIRTGLIYRNPKSQSKHAYFPSVAVMDNGERLTTYVIGEAFEAANSNTHISLSTVNIAFLCYKKMVSNIRWFKLNINEPENDREMKNKYDCRVSEGTPLPEELIRGGQAGGLVDGTVIIAGGNNWSSDKTIKYWLRNSLFFSDGRWIKGPDLPKPLAYSMYAHDENGFYVAGGTVDGNLLSADTYVLSSLKKGGGWKTLPQLPKAMAYGAGVIKDGKFYVACGSSGTENSNSMWVLDLNKPESRWSECQSLPGKPRMFPSFVAAGKYLYLLGGLAETSPLTPLNDIYRYDPGKDEWEQLKDMPFKGYAWVSRPLDDKHLVVTGRADGSIHDGIWIFDLENISFQLAGKLVIPSTTAPLVPVNENKWWLIGGEPDANKNRTGKVSVIQIN